MKIYYFSPFDILRARTNQIGDVRLCEGFAENGCKVELIVPYVYQKDNLRKAQIFESYGVKTPYKVTILKTPFLDNTYGSIRLLIIILYNFLKIFRILLLNMARLSDVIIMSRSTDLLVPAIFLKKTFRLRSGPKVISWVHEVISKKRYIWVYRNSDGVVGTNSAITEDLRSKLRIPSEKLAVSLNPITESQLSYIPDKAETKKKLNINTNKPLVVYTGKLYIGQKEAEYILEAADLLPAYHFLLTGGRPNVVAYYKKWCKQRKIFNVSFTGFIHNYNEIRYYQFAADVLISYYSTEDHIVQYNLPNKICEYMLTRSPIVTCNYPAIKDVLNESNSIFVEAENPDSLAEGIRKAVQNKEESRVLAKQAFHDVAQITFKKRTKLVLDFFESL